MGKVVQQYGLPVEIDPSEALQQEIDRTQGIVEFLAEKLRNAGAADLVERITIETSTGDSRYVMKRTESAVGPWLELFLAERRHLANITGKAMALGLEEQRLELDRRGALATEAAVLYLIHALGLSERDPDVRATISASIVEAQRAYRAATLTAALPMKR